MVVTDRVANDSADAPARVREALEKAFYLGGGRARVITVIRDNGRMKPVPMTPSIAASTARAAARFFRADAGAIFRQQPDRRMPRM